MNSLWSDSYLFGNNAEFIEELYDKYLQDKSQVDQKWQEYFDTLVLDGTLDASHNTIKEKFSNLMRDKSLINKSMHSENDLNIYLEIIKLVEAYRRHGVLIANLDPLKRVINKTRPDTLQIINYKNLSSDLTQTVSLSNISALSWNDTISINELINRLEAIYCANIGFEFSHIIDETKRLWLQNYIENNAKDFVLTFEEQKKILAKLTVAETLEKFLHTKYVGQKRFSLEGGESLIPLLDRIIYKSATYDITDVYIGMAHRGRLNCLVNITGKTPQKLFDEFDGSYSQADFVLSGDVKYHKGYKCQYTINNKKINTTILFNPSHLEVVNPVLNGVVRAKIDTKVQHNQNPLGVIVHGDSALIGLGTNQGVFNMSQTRAYGVGGIVHIVVNNQIGFTTSDIRDVRSSLFCTDIIKMIDAPILHVNADDLNSLIFIVDMAMAYRDTFKQDIMIDMVCFRKYGHNEADDPTITQPLMYKKIKEHIGVRALYANELVEKNIITPEYPQLLIEQYREEYAKGKNPVLDEQSSLSWYNEINLDFKKIKNTNLLHHINTAISENVLQKVSTQVTQIPADISLHPMVKKLLDNRIAMANNKLGIDYGMAETLAYGSLLLEGINVRLVGEDTVRGTFSHRQAAIHDTNRDDLLDNAYIPLQQLGQENNTQFNIYDSILNEECALGFEYGYSTINLNDLVIWEAQFGDFANGAQVMIDQFITSGEAKWGILSKLVLLLPHGYDGQGPEHSSARLERFLQMCAELNMVITNITTSANFFHALRRQVAWPFRKPLINFSPKANLRHAGTYSLVSEFTNGGFKEVIDDSFIQDITAVKKVLFCSGKVYFDLAEKQQKENRSDVAIVRVEQLYPLPVKQLTELYKKYSKAVWFWVQEEPLNMGAASFLQMNLKNINYGFISRKPGAATATGYNKIHQQEQQEIINLAFSI